MQEKVGSGASPVAAHVLLHVDTKPITAAEGSRDIGPISTRSARHIGGDIMASRDCTLQVIRLPDGETEGEASDSLVVLAGVPKLWSYSSVRAPAVLLRVVNTSGEDMPEFALYCRGEV